MYYVSLILLILEQLKAELDKLIEAKDEALSLYQGMEREQFAVKERDYEDRLDKMGAKLNFKLDLEERLMEEIGVLRAQAKEASQRAEVEKKNLKMSELVLMRP